jgi:hypothetical protein
MGVRSAFLLIIVLLIAALAALNWATLATPAVISLGIMQVTAPLGLLMLGLTAALAVFFLIYVLYLQSSVLLETRRHTRELAAQRDLADKAEASRFTELRGFLEAQEQKRSTRHAELHGALLARVDQSDHTLAAHLGQLEDRLDRRDGRPATGTQESRFVPNDRVIIPPRV